MVALSQTSIRLTGNDSHAAILSPSLSLSHNLVPEGSVSGFRSYQRPGCRWCSQEQSFKLQIGLHIHMDGLFLFFIFFEKRQAYEWTCVTLPLIPPSPLIFSHLSNYTLLPSHVLF